jgi:hypothetical protein
LAANKYIDMNGGIPMIDVSQPDLIGATMAQRLPIPEQPVASSMPEIAAVPPPIDSETLAGRMLAANQLRSGGSRGFNVGLLSPEEQAGILRTLIGVDTLQQQQQSMQQQIAEHQLNRGIQDRTIRMKEALQPLEVAKLQAQTTGDYLSARRHQVEINKINTELEALKQLSGTDQIMATLAPGAFVSQWMKDNLGTGNGKEGMKVGYIKFIAKTRFAGDPDAESKAADYVTHQDKTTFIREMLPKVNMSGTDDPATLRGYVDSLSQTYDYMQSTSSTSKPVDAAQGTPSTGKSANPDIRLSPDAASKKYGY